MRNCRAECIGSGVGPFLEVGVAGIVAPGII